MKTDRKLKIENLEVDLFIDELGKIHGGQTSMTSLAGREDPGFCDTPSWSGQRPPLPDYAGMVDEIIGKTLGRTDPLPPGRATTLATFGEE
jgi:hypothetical protein